MFFHKSKPKRKIGPSPFARRMKSTNPEIREKIRERLKKGRIAEEISAMSFLQSLYMSRLTEILTDTSNKNNGKTTYNLLMEFLKDIYPYRKELFSEKEEGQLTPKEECVVFVTLIAELHDKIISKYLENDEITEELLQKYDKEISEWLKNNERFQKIFPFTYSLLRKTLLEPLRKKIMTGETPGIDLTPFDMPFYFKPADRELNLDDNRLRLILVLSGGSAKGMVYSTLLKHLENAGVYPDVIVGTSAGAIAGTLWATGKPISEVEKIFDPKKLKGIFALWKMPFYFIYSMGRYITGKGLKKLLEKVIGKQRIENVPDVFTVSVISLPQESMGVATLIGALSKHNSKNGKIYGSIEEKGEEKGIKSVDAALASAAMEGILPPVVLEDAKLYKFTNSSPYIIPIGKFARVSLEDGGIIHNLPLQAAEAIAKIIEAETGDPSLIIAIHLGYVDYGIEDDYRPSFRKEWEKRKNTPFWKKPLALLSSIWAFSKGYFNYLIEESAPNRAIRAFQIAAKDNTVKELMRDYSYPIVLVNPNYDGGLNRVSLLGFKGSDIAKIRGHVFGRELVEILLENA